MEISPRKRERTLTPTDKAIVAFLAVICTALVALPLFWKLLFPAFFVALLAVFLNGLMGIVLAPQSSFAKFWRGSTPLTNSLRKLLFEGRFMHAALALMQFSVPFGKRNEYNLLTMLGMMTYFLAVYATTLLLWFLIQTFLLPQKKSLSTQR